MTRLSLVLPLLLCASAATAQFVTAPGVTGNAGGAPAVNGFEGSQAFGPTPFDYRDTPSTEADRMKKALALRAEAIAFQTQDGGTLSVRHKAYINRKAHEILGY